MIVGSVLHTSLLDPRSGGDTNADAQRLTALACSSVQICVGETGVVVDDVVHERDSGCLGISEGCLHRWLKIADRDDRVEAGTTATGSDESAELREGTQADQAP